MVNTLSKKERDIQKQITATKKQQEQLNRMIKSAMEAEIRAAETASKKEKSTSTKKAGTSMPMTPATPRTTPTAMGIRTAITDGITISRRARVVEIETQEL